MRKIVGILAAVVLGVVGVVLLSSYVQSARDEIREDEELVQVFVVTESIPAGASIEEVISRSTLSEVPVRLRAVGAVDSVDDVSTSRITDAAMFPGEQVIADRFVEPFQAVAADVPPGRQELTLRLDPERAVGGVISPGAKVGVVVSIDRDEAAAAPEGTAEAEEQPVAQPSGEMTALVLQNVLVTNLQYTSPEDSAQAMLVAAAGSEDLSFTATAPLLVTLALTSSQVEQVVFAAEFGAIYLTLEGQEVDEADASILAGLDVFVTSGGDE
jgi:pilus assembly protein CpaB